MLLSALSCTKESGPEAGSDELIAVGAQVAQTKAMLDGEFNSGSTITVYDWLNPTSGNDRYHMENVGVQYDGSEWSYVVDYPHRWEEGKHKFFGWITKDAGMPADCDTPGEFFGNGFVFGNQVLTIPEKRMDGSVDQFDFVYSEIYNREYYKSVLNSGSYVELEMKHLFTAVSIGVENSTSSYVTIKEFRIENIPTTRSATVNYGGASVAVNYSNWKSGTMTRELNNEYTVSPGLSRGDIFTGSTDQKYMLLWPTEAQHLHSTDKLGTEEGNVIYPETWKMYIKYTIDGTPYEKRINFPNTSWEAGKKNQLTIVFADKMVDLKVQVKDWEYEPQDINYENEVVTVSSGGTLTWNNSASTVDHDKKMVFIVNAQSAKAQFTLQSPIGGSWIVSMVGDVNAFTVSPSTGIIDSETATITIKPEIDSPTRDYKVQLKFTVRRSDGRLIVADNIIQSAGVYTVVLPRNN